MRRIRCVSVPEESRPSARVTFRNIDEATGVYLGDLKAEGWALEIWFAEVYDIPVENLPAFDLARTCRQHAACESYLPAVVPLCLALLEQKPLAGEDDFDDGQLLSGLINLPASYWSGREEQWKAVEAVATAALNTIEYNERLKKEISRFLARYTSGIARED